MSRRVAGLAGWRCIISWPMEPLTSLSGCARESALAMKARWLRRCGMQRLKHLMTRQMKKITAKGQWRLEWWKASKIDSRITKTIVKKANRKEMLQAPSRSARQRVGVQQPGPQRQ